MAAPRDDPHEQSAIRIRFRGLFYQKETARFMLILRENSESLAQTMCLHTASCCLAVICAMISSWS